MCLCGHVLFWPLPTVSCVIVIACSSPLVCGGHSIAVPKHFGAYSVECFNASGGPNEYPNCPVYRSNYDAVVDEMDLRETYYPAWEAAVVEANASGVMCSYNSINGVPACLNGDVLRSTLQGDWRAAGFVISDADAVALAGNPADQDPPGGHKFTATLLASAVGGLINGTTISLEDDDPESNAFVSQLPLALAQGLISMDDLRSAARRAIAPRFAVGLYDPPSVVPWTAIPATVIESEAHHLLARRAAAESYVLLKNVGGLLPLLPPDAGGPASIAVVGAAANCSACIINRYSGHPNRSTTIYEGIAAYAAAAGAAAALDTTYGETAVATVAAAGVAVIVVSSESEGESHDRERLGLPAGQLEFLLTLAARNITTPLIVCVVSGGAVDVSYAAESPAVGAIIALGTGGMEAGAALADVLWGAVNPSGVLAATVHKASWVNASDFLSMSMRTPPGRSHRYLTPAATVAHVLYPFGYGLSYSAWESTVVELQPASVSAATLAAGSNVTLTVRVLNAGPLAGSRVSYAFMRRRDAPAVEEWPLQWLPRAGFTKLHGVEPGASAIATLVVTARDVSRWDAAAHAFTVRPGTYDITVRDGAGGSSSGNATDATLVVTS